MKLSNVNNEMPYSLKFNGTEIPDSEFYLLTNLSHIENDHSETICGLPENKIKVITLLERSCLLIAKSFPEHF